MSISNSKRINVTVGNEPTAMKNYTCIRNIVKVMAKTFGYTMEEVIEFITKAPNVPGSSLKYGSFNNYCRTGRVSEYTCNLFFKFFNQEISIEVFRASRLFTLDEAKIALVNLMNRCEGGMEGHIDYKDFHVKLAEANRSYRDIVEEAIDNYYVLREERFGDGLIDERCVEENDNLFLHEEAEIELFQQEFYSLLEPYEQEAQVGFGIVGSKGVWEALELENLSEEEQRYLPETYMKALKDCLSYMSIDRYKSKGPEFINDIISLLEKQVDYFKLMLKFSEIEEKLRK